MPFRFVRQAQFPGRARRLVRIQAEEVTVQVQRQSWPFCPCPASRRRPLHSDSLPGGRAASDYKYFPSAPLQLEVRVKEREGWK